MWAQWQGVSSFVLRLSCLRRDRVYVARLRGELLGFKVTKWAHLDQGSHNVLWTTGGNFPFLPFLTLQLDQVGLFLDTAARSCCNMTQLVLHHSRMYYMPEASDGKYSACDTCTVRHACRDGSFCGHLSRGLPAAAKEVSATTGKTGAWPACLAVRPMNGTFVKGGSEDTWEVCN